MTALLNPKFPQTTEDYAEIGEALVRLYVTRGHLGHEVMTSTCVDYIARDIIDNDAGRLVWDIAVATSPYRKQVVEDARARLDQWTIESGLLHAVAEVQSELMPTWGK